MTQAQQAMHTLTSQYYNAVVAGCGLSPANFQLYQSHMPLGTLTEDIWAPFNAVPPQSVANYYDPTQLNIFSQDYGAVINHLNPQNSNDFQNAMGDYYSQWSTYLGTMPPLPPDGGILQLFKNWSVYHMPPGQAQTCYTLYQEISQGAVPLAVEAWISMQHAASNKGVAAFSRTLEDLRNALTSGQPQSFYMNSQTESSDISHTWAKMQVGGLFDFFWGGGNSSYDHWTQLITAAGLTIKVSFGKLVTFAAGPLFEASQNPILKLYTPWYNSAALSLAYHTNDNIVWQHGSPNWASTFGSSGNMQRFCGALIAVDGIDLQVSSSAGIAVGDQTSVKAAVSGGFWPFFEANGSGGWNHSTNFDDNGGISITSKCVPGNPQILGVLVSTIDKIFG